MSRIVWRSWNGVRLTQRALDIVAEAMEEVGLRCEGAAKKQLKKGRGVITGTLRRSIHTAIPDYNYFDDDVKPSSGSPERGGRGTQGRIVGKKVMIALGAGVKYAFFIEKRYGYIKEGVESQRKNAPAVIKRYLRTKL
jgi:hypothetical protein